MHQDLKVKKSVSNISELKLICGIKILAVAILYICYLRSSVSDYDRHFIYIPKDIQSDLIHNSIEANFFNRLTPYDGQWYIDISQNGYRQLDPKLYLEKGWPQGNYAFYPLLPLILNQLHNSLSEDFYIHFALIILCIFSTTGLLICSKLGKRLGLEATITILLIASYPSHAFQYILYTEAIFLCLSSACLYSLMKGNFYLSSCFGLLASLSRPQGILLSLPIGVELLQHYRDNKMDKSLLLKRIPTVLTPFTGIVVMSIVGYLVVNSSSAFVDIQSNWGRSLSLLNIYHSVVDFFDYTGPPLDRFGFLFGLLMIPVMWRKLPLSFTIYGVGMVLLPLLTGSILSYSRFISVSIPHFLAAGMLLQSRPKLLIIVLTILLITQVLLMKGLISWHFVG